MILIKIRCTICDETWKTNDQQVTKMPIDVESLDKRMKKQGPLEWHFATLNDSNKNSLYNLWWNIKKKQVYKMPFDVESSDIL